MSSVPENAALIGAYLDGDSGAFEHLFHRYATRLVNFVNRMIGDRDRAEDLVQEAFLRVHRHLPRFDRSRQFSTWLYTIASNLAKNELRDRKRSPLRRDLVTAGGGEGWEPIQLEDHGARPDTLYRQRHLSEAVDRSVAVLSDRHREVFVLREMEGRSYEEIAQMTGVNLGTVKSRLNRARQSFASAIRPYLD